MIATPSSEIRRRIIVVVRLMTVPVHYNKIYLIANIFVSLILEVLSDDDCGGSVADTA